MNRSNLAETMRTPNTLQALFEKAGVVDPVPGADAIGLAEHMEPMPHQIGGLNNCLVNGTWGLLDDCGCVSGDTEFLTPSGWKRIDAYQEGDRVCQFDKDTEIASFCLPLRYVQETAPYLVSIKGARGTDQLLSPDHRVLLRTGFSNLQRRGGSLGWKTLTAEEALLSPPCTSHSKIPLTFKMPGCGSEFLSDEQLRVMVAVIADGHFPSKVNTVVIRLKKERKVERLRLLLKEAGIAYREVDCLPEGFKKFSFSAPRREKEFGAGYWGLGERQRKVVFEEFPYWDGSVGVENRGPSFSSTSKNSIDFIQFVCASLGYASSITTRNAREDDVCRRSTEYSVRVRGAHSPYHLPRPEGFTKVEGEAKVYCFTVPTGYLVLRRNGRIFVTGNCGKTMPAQATALYWLAYGYRALVIMPPTLLPQFKESLFDTFPGVEERYKVHILSEAGYPARMSKKAVQATMLRIHKGEPAGVPEDLVRTIKAMRKAEPIPFTPGVVDEIRNTSGPVKSLAPQFGASATAIQNIRRGGLREDLFKEWGENDSWPEILMMSYHMFIKVYGQVTDPYQVLIADEVHNHLCHPSSTTFRRVKQFLYGAGREVPFIAMTGTPVQNLVEDLYGLIRLLNPKAYANKKQFDWMHVDTVVLKDREGNRQDQVIGYRNMQLLHTNLFANASRHTKEQVFTLDKPVVHELAFELDPKHLTLYRKLVRERVLEVEGKTISAVQAQSLRQKALQIATNPAPFSDHPITNNLKALLTELLEDIGCKQHEKVVIFAIYNNTIEEMARWFEDYNPALVYGGSDTQKNVQKFLKDDSCRLMLAHYRSGGVGLNLQSVCRSVICAEPTSVPGEFTQATERVYRKGQDKVVSFWILKALRTGWPKVIESMRGKMKLSRQVTMDKGALLSELLGE